MFPIRRNTLRHGPDEVLITPGTDSVKRIGCDIGPVIASERRSDLPAASQRDAPVFSVGVAAATSCGMENLFAEFRLWASREEGSAEKKKQEQRKNAGDPAIQRLDLNLL